MILQLAAETFVRLIKIIILFTGGRTFVRESQLIQLTLGKNFVKIVPARRDTPPTTPPPTHTLHHDVAHTAHGAAHLLDSSLT